MSNLKIRFLDLSFLSVMMLCISSSIVYADKLVFATEIIRHGERTPSMALPNVPSSPIEDKLGLGQLTPNGINQLIQLGQSFREYYINKYNLLSAYNPTLVYARSTDMDRTLMSANAVLMGMFNDNSQPQPFAIHTLAIKDDSLLLSYLMHYDKIIATVAQDPLMIETNQRLEPKFKSLSSVFNTEITSLEDFISMVDAIYIRKQLKQPLPSELTAEEIDILHSEASKAAALVHHTPEIGALTSSVLFEHLRQNIKNSVGNSKSKKFVLYSGHDVNILGVMSALGVPRVYNPGYASHISVLLFTKDTHEYYVKFLFNDQELNLFDPLMPVY